MAEPKKARVKKITSVKPDVKHLICDMVEPHELGFVGGQCILINSGIVMDNGKLGKRAYSLVSSDDTQNTFELLVKKIGKGVGSSYVHQLKEGDVFEFSGPWGKNKPIVNETKDKSTLFIATDTGITAILGLLKGEAYRKSLTEARLIWITGKDNYFIPLKDMDQWIPKYCSYKMFTNISNSKEINRSLECVNNVENLNLEKLYDKIYVCGDGNVNSAIKTWFINKGYAREQIIAESFFHHERLKTPSAKV